MRVTTVIIGAGHAGLAMSRCLAERSIDHVVLERGEVANSWKTERWDSLRLLTPNWQSRLPGFGYEGDDPDGFRDMAETIAFIERYAEVISAPIETQTTVTSVRSVDGGYEVATDRGTWRARTVVIAVVGASATGTQIAAEAHRSGRPVTVSVGEHVRVPRVYRGLDIKWWMDRCGVLDEHYTEYDNLERVRNLPSPQLAGSDDRHTVDLNSLTDVGVKLIGRMAGLQDGRAQFSGSLPNLCTLADLKMNRLLDRIDEWATDNGLDESAEPPHRFEPTRFEAAPPLGMTLTSGEIRTIIWATGFRPDYSWLDVPVFDRKGRIRHDGGVAEAPGMYLMGIPFLRRRKSSLIDGA
ncbi:MAG: NAD(P)-binding domain-containing protein, partial [Gemmatimonadales bacterium]